MPGVVKIADWLESDYFDFIVSMHSQLIQLHGPDRRRSRCYMTHI